MVEKTFAMKFKGTIWLVLVLVGLVLYTVLIEVPTAKKTDAEKERSEKILLFELPEIEAVDLVQPHQTIHIQRKDATDWEITEPLQGMADSGRVNQLLTELQDAKFARVVEEEPADLATYGLDQPSLKIILHRQKNETSTLLVGDTHAIGHTTFFKVGDQKRVLLAPLSKAQINPSLDNLRDKTLFNYKTDEVTGLIINYLGEVQTFSKRDGQWDLTGPIAAQGDAHQIKNLLNAVRAQRIRDFVEETPDDLSLYGLDQPTIVVTVQLGKERPPWTLRLGSAQGKTAYHAQKNKTGNVFTVGTGLFNTLSKNPLSFMDKTLMAIEDNEVARITIRHALQTVQAIRRDDQGTVQWVLEGADSASANTAAINSLLFDLKDARVAEFVQQGNLKIFGLDVPQKELRITKNDGSEESILLGRANGSGGQYFASRSRDQTVFLLDAETVNKLFRSANDLQNKQLLQFDKNQVAGIFIETPGKTFELKRTGDEWSLLQPESIKKLDAFIGRDILWTAKNLQYDSLAEPGERNQAGLDAPVMTLTLQDAQKQALGKIVVGQPVANADLHYARVDGQSRIYKIKKRFLEEIPDHLDRFKMRAE